MYPAVCRYDWKLTCILRTYEGVDKFLRVGVIVIVVTFAWRCACRGGYRIFQIGGSRPAIRKAGWGVGGGGAVRFRPDMKSGGGGLLYTSGTIRKARRGGGGGDAVRFRHDTKGGGGEEGGCLADEGEVPYIKGRRGARGGCNPQTPPPPPPPPCIYPWRGFCL